MRRRCYAHEPPGSSDSRSPLLRKTLSMICGAVLCAVLASPAFAGPEEGAAAARRPQKRLTDAQIVQNLRKNLARFVAQDRFSGSVLLAKNGHILFEQAYGFADHAFNAANRVDTKFNLASMGKMFTAVSILQLAQQGKLAVGDKLSERLPDYPNRDVAGRITIHQLLTHTSGLGDFFGKEFSAASMTRFRTLESLLPLFVDKPLLFDPGTSWSYSNGGYIVLGLVIQHASAQSYYDYVRQHVFEPAGMLNTDNYQADADVPNLALGYTRQGEPSDAPRRSNIAILQRGGSAGGGYSTVEDLLRFAQALQEHRLLNPQMTDLAMTGKADTPFHGEKYGYGFQEQVMNGVRIVGHGGGAPGINGNLDMYPELGYTAVVLSNYDGGAMLVNARLRMDLTGRSLPEAVRVLPNLLESAAGQYAVPPPPGAPAGTQLPPMIVTADEAGLWIDLGAGGRQRFLPINPTEFFNEDVPDMRITMTRNPGGAIAALELTGLIPDVIKATKIP